LFDESYDRTARLRRLERKTPLPALGAALLDGASMCDTVLFVPGELIENSGCGAWKRRSSES
jgi:hypothetical protein